MQRRDDLQHSWNSFLGLPWLHSLMTALILPEDSQPTWAMLGHWGESLRSLQHSGFCTLVTQWHSLGLGPYFLVHFWCCCRRVKNRFYFLGEQATWQYFSVCHCITMNTPKFSLKHLFINVLDSFAKFKDKCFIKSLWGIPNLKPTTLQTNSDSTKQSLMVL